MSERQSAAAGSAPGWYDDPKMAGTLRYWDGARWTDQVAPTPASVPSPGSANAVPDGLLVAGYITMILVPIVGAVIGIIALAKGEAKAGGWILGVSIVSAIVGTYLVLNAASTTTYGY